MALTDEDIAHLQQQRFWYLERIQAIHDGTYNVTQMHLGEPVDPDHEGTLARFQEIVASLDNLLG